ncbi:MarR family winged helix-turn-helix transcriptional regulator [Streptomyces sp. SID161]|uniref:MarR family winged helix-turn-helix transcriptional regulator n=1 Tax=unclassified Streptomyces TaxID=2593676 RepID=UPI00136C1796|nr:MarR family winged helix-turn-helix transcriptional regulator [Streptomyces sp. SID161]MYW20413.1 MarR family transcriptional regulator [Streptomyces sp. SID2955]MYW47584.1 MarR family transcriptional regulator [Streptomyces sp. SID161]
MSDETALLVADVFEAAGALRRLGEETAGAEGLTQARWQVLSAVSAEPLTVPQTARRLGVSRQNTQRVANDLVALRLAAFAPNPDHRGSPLLTLTPRGRESLARVTARAEDIHRTLFAAIPDEEIRATRAALRRLLTELDRHEGTTGKR